MGFNARNARFPCPTSRRLVPRNGRSSPVEKGGKLKMVVGTPGGSTIITSVLQNILNVVDYNMGMQESVNTPRFHHQWLPDLVRMEPNGFDEKTKNKLYTCR